MKREKIGKKPFKYEEKEELKRQRINTTDPDSGYYHRDHKEEGFMYLDHRTVDGKNNIIIDCHITPGNVHDSGPYIDRLNQIERNFGLIPGKVALDSGYYSLDILKQLDKKNIFSVIGYRRFSRSKDNHINADYYDEARLRRISKEGKLLYKRRKETVERSFADSKQNHGYRYAQYRGKAKVQSYAWLSCCVQNMKTIALREV